MESEFLTETEKQYIFDKAEFLKISAMIADLAKLIESDFTKEAAVTHNYKPDVANAIPGATLELRLYLDNILPEKLESALPEIKKHLSEYHRLRIHQRGIEKRLDRLKVDAPFEVVERKEKK